MTPHTPGPWTIPHFARDHGCGCRYVFAGDYCGGIAEVYVDNGKSISEGGNDCPKGEEAKANAHLISAAPDLLASLREIQRDFHAAHCMTTTSSHGSFTSHHPSCDMARAAIAKAEGKP